MNDATRAIARSERRAALTTITILRRELGLGRAALVVADVARGKLTGRPFGALGPAIDRRDVLSRRQLAPAVLLYRALKKRTREDHALAIVRAIVLSAGVRFLGELLGGLDPRTERGDLAARMSELLGLFFNAEGEVAIDAPSAARFDVARCRFVELLDAIGERELAPIFCEVDRAYFTPERTPITLRRARTLAQGGDRCDFRFEW